MSNSTITVHFEEGMRILATIGKHTIATDQSEKSGGTDTAATPFEVFLSSLATCAGVYAKRFCDKKSIDIKGLKISVDCEYDTDPKKYRVSKVTTNVTLPPDFPPKYEAVLIRNIEACTVKKQILQPPEFVTQVVR